MQLSFYHVTLCLVAMLAVICKVYGSESSSTHLQGEVRKRIFCNFYGCGSKRSANKMADLGPVDASMDDLDIPEGRPFSSDHAQDEMLDMSAQDAALVATQKIIRAAAMWEALKERLRQRNSS